MKTKQLEDFYNQNKREIDLYWQSHLESEDNSMNSDAAFWEFVSGVNITKRATGWRKDIENEHKRKVFIKKVSSRESFEDSMKKALEFVRGES